MKRDDSEEDGYYIFRRPADKTDKPQAPVLCGWNLPIIPDDNDITEWMKREKNGDNKRKKINEVYEEEHYRHIVGHCAAIENKLLFDRQSLHDRYLKNCQFGVRDARANKLAPVAPLPLTQTARVTRPLSQQDRERNCFSAYALAGEPVATDEGEEEEEEGEVDDVGVKRLSRGRSHSAVCHSASMQAYGMTLPDVRPAPLDGDQVKDEGEDAGWDEGYGSKVSSNDQEQDGAEEDSTKTLDDSGTCEESGTSPINKLTLLLNPSQTQPLSHQDAMAKLTYSRREGTVYECLPSRRVCGNSFRYAGREQSRLTEASLSHINPAYLARYHHLADLATAAQGKQTHLANGSLEQCLPQGVENGDGEGSGNRKGLQPKAIVLRKITIQDSGKELFSQNSHPSPGNVTGGASATNQSQCKVYQRQGLVSPTRIQSERSVLETRPPTSQLPRSGGSGSEQVSVRVQELTPDLNSMGTPHTGTTLLPVPSSHARSVISTLSVPSTRATDDPQGSSPMVSPSRMSPASDKLSSMSSFAVTDLLPAVERNLHSQRTGQRGLSKSKTMDVTSGFNGINTRHQQHQQRVHQLPRQQQMTFPTSQNNGEVSGLRMGQEGTSLPNGMMARNSAAEDVPGRSFTGFRPDYHMTPLQRAKEIAHRKIHGRVTQMPDGSETVRVPSPRYASRTDQQTSHRRAKSASRLLGQVMSRYSVISRKSAV